MILHGNSFENYGQKRSLQSARAISCRVMDVRITRLDASLPLPAYQTGGAAGFDLAASVDMTIAPGQVTLVPTGLVIEAPPGHFIGVFARSSTPLKRGLMVANGVGIVDADYSGPEDEIKIEVFNFTAASVDGEARRSSGAGCDPAVRACRVDRVTRLGPADPRWIWRHRVGRKVAATTRAAR